MVDRMSVAAGDDVATHARVLDVLPGRRLSDLVDDLLAQHYLASITGGRATWILEAGGRPVAVLAQQWAAPRYLVDPFRPVGSFDTGDGVALMFRYWLQHDPAHVFAELAAGREPPPR